MTTDRSAGAGPLLALGVLLAARSARPLTVT